MNFNKIMTKISDFLLDFQLLDFQKFFNPTRFRELKETKQKLNKLEELKPIMDYWHNVAGEALSLSREALNDGDIFLYSLYLQQYEGARIRLEEEYTTPFNKLSENNSRKYLTEPIFGE